MNISDITPGMHVRFTAEWRGALQAGGVSPWYIERYSRGVVTHIEAAPFWEVVTFQVSDGSCHALRRKASSWTRPTTSR